MIKAFEPDSVSEGSQESARQQEMQERLAMIERIKESVESDPQRALVELNEIMEILKKQS